MKIFCVGRNYLEHIQELNNLVPETPVIFMKPPTAILKNAVFYFPEFSNDIHYECELIYRVCKNGKYIQEQFAHKYIDAITVGIDFTARDLQQAQKSKGLPWEIAKAFDNSAVIGSWTSLSNETDYANIQFKMLKNEVVVQDANSRLMIHPIQKIIAYISQFFTLQQGDLIFTGTPAGVGPIKIGDLLTGYLGEEKAFQIQIK